MMGDQERQREKLNQLKEQKMKSLKFNWINSAKKKKGRTMNPLIQLSRQLHYLFVALLFASFAVAQSVQAEADKDSSSVAENAAMGNAAKHRNQRMILFDYTTDRIICAFNEQVELHGKIRISFKKTGNKVRLDTASLENFKGVGLTTKREYVADTRSEEHTSELQSLTN